MSSTRERLNVEISYDQVAEMLSSASELSTDRLTVTSLDQISSTMLETLKGLLPSVKKLELDLKYSDKCWVNNITSPIGVVSDGTSLGLDGLRGSIRLWLTGDVSPEEIFKSMHSFDGINVQSMAVYNEKLEDGATLHQYVLSTILFQQDFPNLPVKDYM